MMNMYISKILLILCTLVLASQGMSTNSEYTTLMTAISNADLAAVDSILGKDSKIPNAAMHLALTMGHKDIVMLLLDHGADKTYFMAHLMWILVHDDLYQEVGHELLAMLTDETITQQEKLHRCLVTLKLLPQQLETVEPNRAAHKKESIARNCTLKMFLSEAQRFQDPIDFSQALHIALTLAIMNGTQELIKRTVFCGADVNYRNGLPLIIALRLNCAATTTTLLSLGATLTDDILQQSKVGQADWPL